MSNFSKILPINSTYSVESVFNALTIALGNIRGQLQTAQESEHDATFSIAQLSSALATGNKALNHVKTWREAGVKTVETAIPLNDTNLPPNNPNARLQTQIISGTLKPVVSAPA